MSILGRLLGKKKDDIGLDNPPLDYGASPGFSQPLGSPDAGYGAPMQDYGTSQGAPPGGFTPEAMGFERVPPGSPSYPSSQQSVGEINLGKDLELINAKLDAIKAELDSVNQRLKRIERIAEGETEQHKDKWNY